MYRLSSVPTSSCRPVCLMLARRLVLAQLVMEMSILLVVLSLGIAHVASHYFGLDDLLLDVGAFMADLAGRRSVLFPKIQREAGET